jgi:hypothetical protein
MMRLIWLASEPVRLPAHWTAFVFQGQCYRRIGARWFRAGQAGTWQPVRGK